VRAVSQGFDVPEVPPNRELRARLEGEAAEHGPAILIERLEAVDPVSASRIDPQNTRRVIRALEVTEALGRPFSSHQRRASAFEVLTIVLDGGRERLFGRAEERLVSMVRKGFLAEVASLLEAGYGLELPSMSALGYRELGRHLRGECTLEEALEATRRSTRAFIKRQLTWFKMDAGAHRLDVGRDDVTDCARELVDAWLANASGRQK
jgi:tRNA dimethylallyltransferase